LKIHDAANRNRDTDQREKNDRGPQCARKSSPWLHILFYAEALSYLSIV
jgi:hypothetical protein